jgi:PAS domain S-box-containing protein
MISYSRLPQNDAFTLSLVDGRGLVRYHSPGMADLLGYSVDQVDGTPWFSFLDREDAATVQQQFDTLVDRGSRSGRWSSA